MNTGKQRNKAEFNAGSASMPISGFQEVTLIDWEGRIASIIFISGCNFRCGFCHSKSLVLPESGSRAVPVSAIFQYLDKKQGWIDGVVITGGEPTLYRESLLGLLEDIKNLGLAVKLDTNGTSPEVLKLAIDKGLVDYIAMDIKAPLEQHAYSGAVSADISIEDIKASRDVIIASGIDYEFRTTAVPGVVSLNDVEKISESIMPAKKYRIQQFQAKDTLNPFFLSVKPYSKKELQLMASKAREYIPDTSIRGINP
jgi:pyruvate formate lyase activating enzyme